MKRNFYLVLETLRRIQHAADVADIPTLIDAAFQGSDVKNHLCKKLEEFISRYKNLNTALLELYISVDHPHQAMFDSWINQKIDTLEAVTITNYSAPPEPKKAVLVHIHDGVFINAMSNTKGIEVIFVDEDDNGDEPVYISTYQATHVPILSNQFSEYTLGDRMESDSAKQIRETIRESLINYENTPLNI
jgi:5S rRNA maturation endonuclease (ribonuclease M5)